MVANRPVCSDHARQRPATTTAARSLSSVGGSTSSPSMSMHGHRRVCLATALLSPPAERSSLMDKHATLAVRLAGGTRLLGRCYAVARPEAPAAAVPNPTNRRERCDLSSANGEPSRRLVDSLQYARERVIVLTALAYVDISGERQQLNGRPATVGVHTGTSNGHPLCLDTGW